MHPEECSYQNSICGRRLRLHIEAWREWKLKPLSLDFWSISYPISAEPITFLAAQFNPNNVGNKMPINTIHSQTQSSVLFFFYENILKVLSINFY